jgi:lysophospholipase L1-like esterase
MNKLPHLLLLAVLGLCPARAPAAERVIAFGDSIMAGWNGELKSLFIPGGNLFQRFEQVIGTATGSLVSGRNYAFPGLDSGQIITSLAVGTLDAATATYLLLDAGGNDFLAARHGGQRFEGACNAEGYARALTRFKANWSALLERARAINPRAELRTLGLYFPLINQYRNVNCGAAPGLARARTAYELFLPVMLEVNYTICSTTTEHRGQCADLLAEFNCAPSLRRQCQWRDGESLASYRGRLLKLVDRLQDPEDLGWLQKDHIHPNSRGHRRISELL